jgi:hypothetical protein
MTGERDVPSGQGGVLEKQLQELYEQLGPPSDLDFWLSTVPPGGGAVFYVGPGAGRRLLAMARAGVTVHAAEADRAMADILQRKVALEPKYVRDRVAITVGMVEEMTSERQFGTVLVPSLLLNYAITDPDDQCRFLAACRRLCNAGGTIAIELFNPYIILQQGTLHLTPGEVDSAGTWMSTVIYRSRIKPWTQRCDGFRMTYDRFVPGREVCRYANTTRSVVAIFPRELQALLREAGFSLTDIVSPLSGKEPDMEEVSIAALATAFA